MYPDLTRVHAVAWQPPTHRKDAQVNHHDHGCVRQHAAMTGSRRQAAGAVARDRAVLAARGVAILRRSG
jgi:hypothetical protein